MNTVGKPRSDEASPETDLLTEDHWEAEDQGISRFCREAVADHPAALRSVAHYSNGTLDFVVRPHDSAPLPAPRADRADALTSEGRPGRHLVVCSDDFNRSLQPFGTGELMRVVVGTTAGGMYCARIRAGQHLVGFTLSGDRVPELDRTLNQVVQQIRTTVHHLSDEHLGGDLGLALPEVGTPDAPHFEVGLAVERTDAEASLRLLWRRFVNPVDLQYAAYYRDWSLVCAGDAFDDRSLRVRLMNMTARMRRAMYRDLADRLRTDITRLRHALRPVAQAPIDRLVLDVQEGAVYIHWLGHGTGTFVLAVTVDQPRVEDAENRLRGLLTALPAVPALP